jgi:hypothetical protein
VQLVIYLVTNSLELSFGRRRRGGYGPTELEARMTERSMAAEKLGLTQQEIDAHTDEEINELLTKNSPEELLEEDKDPESAAVHAGQFPQAATDASINLEDGPAEKLVDPDNPTEVAPSLDELLQEGEV